MDVVVSGLRQFLSVTDISNGWQGRAMYIARVLFCVFCLFLLGRLTNQERGSFVEEINIQLPIETFRQQQTASLSIYLVKDGNPHSFMIICPGGSYERISFEKEGLEVVGWLQQQKISSAILSYSVGDNILHAMQPLVELQKAILYVRQKASTDWANFVLPNKIGVIGFSAGGHLAATGSTLWNHTELLRFHKELSAEQMNLLRPDTTVLSYPVITLVDAQFRHNRTYFSLFKHQLSNVKMIEQLSPERQVDSTTSPMFVWHTSTDEKVPVENSVLLALSLQQNKVKYSLHVFSEGLHGLGLSNNASLLASSWSYLCLEWLFLQGFTK